MAKRRRQRGTFESARGDIYKNFYITVSGITGINQNFPPNTIEDTECQQIWNYAYVGRGNIRKIPAAKKLFSTSAPVIHIVSANLNGNYNCLVFLKDGSVYNWDKNTLTQIASAGTLSGDPSYIGTCIWQNQKIYVIDRNGYFRWDGSTWTQVSSSIVGHDICIWQGRVFVANGSKILYTVALDPEDFAGSGSGYIDIASSFPDLKVKVKKLIGYVDSLVIYGDNATMALTGSTISNDPSLWYLTEVSNVTGVQYKGSVVVYKNEIFFQNSKGIFKGTIAQQEKIDYKVDLVSNVIQEGLCAVYPVYNLLNYFIPIQNSSPFRGGATRNGLLFCVDLGEFCFLDIGVDIYGFYYSFVEEYEDALLVLGADGCYQFGSDTTNNMPTYIKTKAFDLGNPHIDKFWWVFILKTQLKGDTTFTIGAETDLQLVRFEISSPAETPLFVFTDEDNNIYYWTDSNQSEIYANYSVATGAIKDLVFKNSVTGNYVVYEIKENSNAIFDIYGFQIKGQLSRIRL